MGQQIVLSIAPKPYQDMSTEEILENAIKEREELLEQKPKLKVFQEEIDRLVRNAGNFENRMAVLGIMIGAKFEELRMQISYLMILTQNMKEHYYLH